MCKTSPFANLTLAACCIFNCLVYCSCEKASDTESRKGFVSYTIDWSKVLPGFQAPAQLSYCFYPAGGGAMIQVNSENAAGLRFSLPVDQYKVIVFNCDPQAVPVRHTDKFDICEAYLPATKASEAISSDLQPLYGVVIDTLTIASGHTQTVELVPEPFVQHIAIKVNIQGAEYMTGCRASLSGVVTALNLSTRQRVAYTPTVVSFDAQQTTSGVSADVIVLGIASGEEDGQPPVSNEIQLDFTLRDGSTVSTAVDMSNQLGNLDNGTKHIDVEIEATIEKEPVFSVTLTGWKVGPGDSSVIE